MKTLLEWWNSFADGKYYSLKEKPEIVNALRLYTASEMDAAHKEGYAVAMSEQYDNMKTDSQSNDGQI